MPQRANLLAACDGSRTVLKDVPNGKRVSNPDFTIKIRNGWWRVELLYKLYEAATLLNVSEIVIAYLSENPHQLGVFTLGEVEILLMPTARDFTETDELTLSLHLRQIKEAGKANHPEG